MDQTSFRPTGAAQNSAVIASAVLSDWDIVPHPQLVDAVTTGNLSEAEKLARDILKLEPAAEILNDFVSVCKYPDRIIPPRDLRRAGKDVDAYVISGNNQRDLLIEHAGLTPHSRLLDIGCGDGRLAAAMINYLETGHYTGNDVNQPFVSFLTRRYAPLGERFQFDYLDLWHSYYNPSGKYRTESFTFPYADKSFDVIWLNSVFSHLTPAPASRYLQEIARLLKPGGTLAATFYLANIDAFLHDRKGTTETDILAGKRHLMNYRGENFWCRDDDFPERIAILDESWLCGEMACLDLEIVQLHWGTWCGRAPSTTTRWMPSQDLLIAKRH